MTVDSSLVRVPPRSKNLDYALYRTDGDNFDTSGFKKDPNYLFDRSKILVLKTAALNDGSNKKKV